VRLLSPGELRREAASTGPPVRESSTIVGDRGAVVLR
jgi:hypothetical protein